MALRATLSRLSSHLTGISISWAAVSDTRWVGWREMLVNFILRCGLLLVTLSLAIAKHKQSSFTKSCYPRGTLSQAVDALYIKAAWLKATIPVSIRLCLKSWPQGHLQSWIQLVSLCFIVGRPHKKYTIIKKENKKAVYGKSESLLLFYISTYLMFISPCI